MKIPYSTEIDTWHPYGENDGAVGDIQLVADYQHGAPPGP